MVLRGAGLCWEHKTVLALRSELPLAQRIDDHWADRERALARGGLRYSNNVVAIRSLADCERAAGKVHIRPLQPAQLAGTQAGKSGHHEKRSASALGGRIQQAPNFIARRDVLSDFEPVLSAPIRVDLDIGGYILG